MQPGESHYFPYALYDNVHSKAQYVSGITNNKFRLKRVTKENGEYGIEVTLEFNDELLRDKVSKLTKDQLYLSYELIKTRMNELRREKKKLEGAMYSAKLLIEAREKSDFEYHIRVRKTKNNCRTILEYVK